MNAATASNLDSDVQSVPGRYFNLSDTHAYQRWRTRKLARYPSSADELRVEIQDPNALSGAEIHALQDRCRRANMAIYRIADAGSVDKDAIRRLGQQLGLVRLDSNLCADHDSITSLQVMDGGRHAGYIPYSNRALNWHTDGYYNPPDQRIHAFLIHCVRPAASGGENHLLDPEMVYLKMRDENPEFVAALMKDDAMRIPANEEDGQQIRGDRIGPVFSLDRLTHQLHMRYTARKRNIIWKDDPDTRAAVGFLETLLAGELNIVFRYRLSAGEGLVCNNVLHNRSAFTDDDRQGTRLLYRARYYDRIDAQA